MIKGTTCGTWYERAPCEDEMIFKNYLLNYFGDIEGTTCITWYERELGDERTILTNYPLNYSRMIEGTTCSTWHERASRKDGLILNNCVFKYCVKHRKKRTAANDRKEHDRMIEEVLAVLCSSMP